MPVAARFRAVVVTCLLVSFLGPVVPAAQAQDEANVEQLVLHFPRARLTTTAGEQFEARGVTLRGHDLWVHSKLQKGASGGVGYRSAYQPMPGDPDQQIPLAQIERIQIRGDTKAGMGAGIGALAGAGFALILVATTSANDDLSGAGVVFGVLIWSGIGAAVGAAIGSAVQEWDTIYPAVHATPTR